MTSPISIYPHFSVFFCLPLANFNGSADEIATLQSLAFWLHGNAINNNDPVTYSSYSRIAEDYDNLYTLYTDIFRSML